MLASSLVSKNIGTVCCSAHLKNWLWEKTICNVDIPTVNGWTITKGKSCPIQTIKKCFLHCSIQEHEGNDEVAWLGAIGEICVHMERTVLEHEAAFTRFGVNELLNLAEYDDVVEYTSYEKPDGVVAAVRDLVVTGDYNSQMMHCSRMIVFTALERSLKDLKYPVQHWTSILCSMLTCTQGCTIAYGCWRLKKWLNLNRKSKLTTSSPSRGHI